MSEIINASTDVLGGSVIRYNLNTTTPHQAVIRKIIAGNGIVISSTGVDTGTGDVTISIDTSGTGGTGGEGGGTPTAVGTVTSINMVAPLGLTIMGAPITTAGTIVLQLTQGYTIPFITDIEKGIDAWNNKVISANYNSTTGVLTFTQQNSSTITATIPPASAGVNQIVYGTGSGITSSSALIYSGGTIIQTSTNLSVHYQINADQNDIAKIVISNINTGISSSAGIVFSNNLGHLSQVYFGSSTNTTSPDSFVLQNISGTALILATSTGYVDISRSATLGSSVTARFLNNGNILFGTLTDDGYKLDVNGIFRLGAAGSRIYNNSSNVITFDTQNVFCTFGGDDINLKANTAGFISLETSYNVRFRIASTTGNILMHTVTDELAKLNLTGSVTATTAIARGAYFYNTLVASANNDTLVGLDIAPTYTNGVFTGIFNIDLRTKNAGVVIGSSYNYGINFGNANDGIVQIKDAGATGLLGEGHSTTQMIFRPANNGISYNSNYWSYIEQNSLGFIISSGRYHNLYLRASTTSGASADLHLQAGPTTMALLKGATGNFLIGTTTDSGYRLDVYGSARVGISGNTSVTYLTNEGRSTLKGGVTLNDWLNFSGASIGYIYSNNLVITTNNSLSNSSASRFTITQQIPSPNSGTGTVDLLYLNHIVNTGASVANSRALVIDFSVTSNAGTLTAIDALQGKIKFGDLSGSGTRMVVVDSTGLLSTQAVPTFTSVNIYNSDGTLTGNRVVTMSGYYLKFTGGNLQVSNASNNTFIINSGSTSGDFIWSGSNVNYSGTGGSNVIISTGPTHSAKTSANSNVIIGPWAGGDMTTASSNIFLGYSAGGSVTSGGGNIFIGRNMGRGVTTGVNNIFLGTTDTTNIPSTTSTSIHIVAGGYELNDGATALGSLAGNYAFIGGGYNSALYVKSFFFGGAPFVLFPANADIVFYAPSGTGTNAGGSNFTITPGRGTGTGTGGDLVFSTATTGSSGTTVQSITQRMVVKWNTGNVGIGYTTATLPNTYKFDVSGTGRFTSTLWLTTTAISSSVVDAIVITSGDGGNYARISFGDGNTAIMRSGNVLRLQEYTGSINFYQTGSGGRSIGTIAHYGTSFTPFYALTTGSASYAAVTSSPTINNTGGTSTVRGFYYNPTTTSLTGTTHYAFESTAGKIKVSDLAGSGDRFIVVDASGVMSTATIGSGLSYSGGVLSATGGAVGTITGTGTAGKIAKFTSASDIADSIMTEGTGTITISGTLTANSFIKSGGTSSQFLKADGSVDTTVYVSSGNLLTDYDSAITGSRNSINTLFTLTNNFQTGTTRVFVNGIRMTPGLSYDYTETSSNQITFVTAPDAGDLIVVDYIKQ